MIHEKSVVYNDKQTTVKKSMKKRKLSDSFIYHHNPKIQQDDTPGKDELIIEEIHED